MDEASAGKAPAAVRVSGVMVWRDILRGAHTERAPCPDRGMEERLSMFFLSWQSRCFIHLHMKRHEGGGKPHARARTNAPTPGGRGHSGEEGARESAAWVEAHRLSLPSQLTRAPPRPPAGHTRTARTVGKALIKQVFLSVRHPADRWQQTKGKARTRIKKKKNEARAHRSPRTPPRPAEPGL